MINATKKKDEECEALGNAGQKCRFSLGSFEKGFKKVTFEQRAERGRERATQASEENICRTSFYDDLEDTSESSLQAIGAVIVNVNQRYLVQ